MRFTDDISYEDYKENVEDAFHLLDDEEIQGAASIAEYEVRHNMLEDRIRNGAAYHIYRYENMGRYKQDLSAEEIEQVEKDMAYIKSHVKLPKLKAYADRDYG